MQSCPAAELAIVNRAIIASPNTLGRSSAGLRLVRMQTFASKHCNGHGIGGIVRQHVKTHGKHHVGLPQLTSTAPKAFPSSVLRASLSAGDNGYRTILFQRLGQPLGELVLSWLFSLQGACRHEVGGSGRPKKGGVSKGEVR